MNTFISIDRAIANAAASVEIEGFRVTAQHKELCRKPLNKEITKAEYIRQITEAAKGQQSACCRQPSERVFLNYTPRTGFSGSGVLCGSHAFYSENKAPTHLIGTLAIQLPG